MNVLWNETAFPLSSAVDIAAGMEQVGGLPGVTGDDGRPSSDLLY